MKKYSILFVTCFFISFSSFSHPFTSDSVEVKIKPLHSPKKATLMSLAVPGLGQVYNKKYWKLPIIYTGIGVALYLGIENQKMFKGYSAEYLDRQDTTLAVHSLKYPLISTEQLLADREDYRKNRDLSYVIAGVFYMLNIIDAAVDAHFYSFDINDDLSLNINPFTPVIFQGRITPAVNFSFRF